MYLVRVFAGSIRSVLVLLLAGLFLAAPPPARAATWYVSAAAGNDSNAGTSWAAAKQTIQAAVDAASTNDLVWVTNGLYAMGGRPATGHTLTNRVAVEKPLTLKSVNGPDVTQIVGQADPASTNGDAALRCVWVGADTVFLTGFTLTNGHTRAADASDDLEGGGLRCAGDSVVVSNCVMTGNTAAQCGGGMSAWARCRLDRCRIAMNFAGTGGGGAASGTFYNCVFTRNTTLSEGGGALGASLYGCLVTSNVASAGGGAGECELYNCTVTANSADSGGGIYWSYNVFDSILYDNYATNGSNYGTYDSPQYCCTFPLPTNGVWNITNAPYFVNAAAGDYHLQAGSPCTDAGTNLDWMIGTTDLDGNPRLVGGRVDIGAYESIEIDTGVSLLQVTSLFGQPSPSGTVSLVAGSNVVCTLAGSPLSAGPGARYFCTGWTRSGSSPGSGSGTNTSFTITNYTTLTWNWSLQYQLTASAGAYGTVSGSPSGWYDAGSTMTVSAVTNANARFAGWFGDTQGDVHNPTMTLTNDHPRTVTALFNSLSSPAGIIRVTGTLDFGNVQIGQSATNVLTIANDGNKALVVSGISYPAGGVFTGNWSGTIPAGGATNILVVFLPAIVQSYGGSITVNSDAAGGIAAIGCSGTGRPVWYVRPDGSDTNVGVSWVSAKQTIQAAVDAAVAGDYIMVSNGVYSVGSGVAAGQTNIVVVDKPLVLQSLSGSAQTILDGGNSNRCLVMASPGVVVNGFQIIRGLADQGGGVLLSNGLLRNCLIQSNTATAQGGGVYASAGLLSGCIITANTVAGAGPARGGGVCCAGTDAILRNCLILHNQARTAAGFNGVSNPGYSAWGGSAYAATGGAISGGCLQNCTIIGNSAIGGTGGAGADANSTETGWEGGDGGSASGGGAAGAYLYNCIVCSNSAVGGAGGRGGDSLTIYHPFWTTFIEGGDGGNGGDAAGGGTAGCTLYNCALSGNFALGGALGLGGRLSGLPGGSNNVDGASLSACLFAAPQLAADYRLAQDSPCIDAGTNQDWMTGTTDLAGNPRIQGARADIGAYEFIASGPRLLSPVRSTGSFSVSVLTDTAKTYWLEYKNSLSDPVWTPLLPGVAGDGTIRILVDATASVPHRFYRLGASSISTSGGFGLSNLVRSNGTFAVSVSTASGKTYFLEYKNSLSDTNWTALPAVSGDGTVKALTDPTATAPQRFFRVRAQ